MSEESIMPNTYLIIMTFIVIGYTFVKYDNVKLATLITFKVILLFVVLYLAGTYPKIMFLVIIAYLIYRQYRNSTSVIVESYNSSSSPEVINEALINTLEDDEDWNVKYAGSCDHKIAIEDMLSKMTPSSITNGAKIEARPQAYNIV